MLEFGNGEARLVAAKVSHEGLLVGQKISVLKEHIPNTEGRIAAIYRDGQPLLPDGETDNTHKNKKRYCKKSWIGHYSIYSIWETSLFPLLALHLLFDLT